MSGIVVPLCSSHGCQKPTREGRLVVEECFFLESTELFGKKRLPKNHISMGEDLILKTKYHLCVNDPESTYLQVPMAYGATL